MTATDEADLARRMERAEAENTLVDGDEDEDNEEGIKFNENGEEKGDVDGDSSDDDKNN